MFFAGNRNLKLDQMEVQCISQASALLVFKYTNIKFQSDAIKNWRMDGES